MIDVAPAMERTIAVATELDGGAAALRASPAERVEPARARSSFAGTNRWVALAAAFLLHAAILGPLLIGVSWGPSAAPPAQEIPVEIVAEPPKPPPEPQPQPSAAPRPPIDLEPAHDAPRAVSDEKSPRVGTDAKSSGEKSATPDSPQSGATPQPSEAAKAEPPSRSPPAAAKDDAGDLTASKEAPTLPEAPATSADAPNSQSKVATMIGQPLPTWSKGKQFSTFNPLPDVPLGDLGASPVDGGQARTTYLTVVYGLIMKHLRLTEPVRVESRRLEGAIDFVVDAHGDVVERSVTQPSGSNELDAAALEAVREAAPYPMPPMAMPIALKFTFGGK